MKINFKLYASLSEHLPPGAHENTVQIEIPVNSSLNSIIDKYHVPREMAHLVLVNGVFACSADRDKTILKDGDTLAIWPPVAGG
ncbi:MAG: MoaD/ThiS family protein [Gammaproteobacteria bacterium]|nr:MoaD/ThiS family protein [Gammaproteobacteria bacterium]